MTDRDDLKSSFRASLDELQRASSADLQLYPANAARIAVEGALENPAEAGILFDKISDALNAMPERTAKQRERKRITIASFLFAMVRERERAEFNAPKRWQRVLDKLRTR